MPGDQIQYSEKYSDDKYEYRHVILPADLTRHVPKTHLMSETEWRNLGVQQSPGWVHYMMHVPDQGPMFQRLPEARLIEESIKVYIAFEIRVQRFKCYPARYVCCIL